MNIHYIYEGRFNVIIFDFCTKTSSKYSYVCLMEDLVFLISIFFNALPSRTFCVTVNVLPVSRGTVQFTGSGERMIICSGDFTLVGSGGLFTTGSSSIHGLAFVAGAGAGTCDGGVEATLESPPVTSPFIWGSAVTGTYGAKRFIVGADNRSKSPTPVFPAKLALDDESNRRGCVYLLAYILPVL